MLNRRHIRIKVLQALYAYFHSETESVAVGEKELFFSLNKVYELYIHLLSTFREVREVALDKIELGKQKRLPTEHDIKPNTRFVDNPVMVLLANNAQLTDEIEKNKIFWPEEREMFTRIFDQMRKSDEFVEYMAREQSSFEEDKEILVALFKPFLANSEQLQFYFDEKSIYWQDDLDLVCSMVIKTIRHFTPDSDENEQLMPLFKNKDEEEEFAKELFRTSIKIDDEATKLVEAKTQNWELERIATMDILLMKMAIAEVMAFPSIPTKVTLNEYIEISKFYSTPKSNMFINGILDNIFADLRETGKIKKVGRGLIE